jgi:hypothetical protein
MVPKASNNIVFPGGGLFLSVIEDFVLLGCDAAPFRRRLATFRRNRLPSTAGYS